MCIMSQSNRRRIQEFQNGNLLQIQNTDPDNRLTAEQIHNLYHMESINVRNYNRATKSWENFKDLYPELVQESEQIDSNIIKDHYWWQRIAKYIQAGIPAPQF